MKGSRPEQAALTKDTDLTRTESTRGVIEGMVDGLNDHRIQDIGEFFSSSFRWMGNVGCGTKHGLREFQDNWQKPFQAAFSDKVCTDEARLYMGEWAAAFGAQKAVHSGEFMGIAATGREVEIRYMDFWKVVDGKIVDNWVMVDFPHILAQLGVDVFNGEGWENFDNGNQVSTMRLYLMRSLFLVSPLLRIRGLTENVLSASCLAMLFMLVVHQPALSKSQSQSSQSNHTLSTLLPGKAMRTKAYEFEFQTIEGDSFSLLEFKDKVIMVVNTASRCGFTDQYGNLQALWEQYRGREFVLLGVPSNDFGQQEPGSADEIKQFCELNFNVDFQLTEKVGVSGEGAHPFYQWVAEHNNGDAIPQWNFHKLLVDREGNLVASFPSSVKPDATKVTTTIERLLADEESSD